MADASTERTDIVRLLDLYATALDSREWVLLREVFTANAAVNFLEVGRLAAVELVRLNEVSWPQRDVQRFLEVHIDVAEGERVAAIVILKPTLEDGHDRPARIPYHLR